MSEPFKLDSEKLEISAALMRAVAHPLRLKILEYIDKNKAVNVNKIYNALKLEQSITSQHLRILRQVGVVETQREGKYIHYSICYEKLSEVVAATAQFLKEER